MKKIILLVLMLVSVAAAAFASSDTPATTDTGGRTELVFVIDKSGSMLQIFRKIRRYDDAHFLLP